MTKQIELTVNPKLRMRYINRIDVINKVGNLKTLPKSNVSTVKQIAEFYRVSTDKIQAVLSHNFNRSEVFNNGVIKVGYSEFKEKLYDLTESKEAWEEMCRELGIARRPINIFPKQAVLNIGFLLRYGEVAKEVREMVLKDELNELIDTVKVELKESKFNPSQKEHNNITYYVDENQNKKKKNEAQAVALVPVEEKSCIPSSILKANSSIRVKYIHRTDVLDMVGTLEFLPNTTLSTNKQVAEFYNVTPNKIRAALCVNKEELLASGILSLAYNEVLSIILGEEKMQYGLSHERAKELGVSTMRTNAYTKRAILLIGFLLPNSPVADKVRELVMTTEQITEPTGHATTLFSPKLSETIVVPNSTMPTVIVEPEQKFDSTESQVNKYNGQFVIDSRDLIIVLDRGHFKLVRDIDRKIGYLERKGVPFVSENIIESTYISLVDTNVEYPCYKLTKKGCELFATRMTFDNKKRFTDFYTEKFNEMENQSKSQETVEQNVEQTPVNKLTESNESTKSTGELIKTQVNKENEIVIIQNNQAVTTSLQIAETFGKRHDDVLKAIKNLAPQIYGTKGYFYESTYDKQGKQYPMFYMNRDGFALLVMGFTGKKAMKFKIQYIKKFNQMEEQLKSQSQAPVPVASYMISDPIERAKQWIVEQQEKMLLEEKVQEQSKVIEEKQFVIDSLAKEVPLAERRQFLNMIMRKGCFSEREIKRKWMFLYRHFNMKYHVNLTLRKERYEMKFNKEISYLNIVEYQLDMLNELYELAIKLFVGDASAILAEMESVLIAK